ncbi:MAG TPA: hypothetical protein VIJ15_12170 [Dermatophilaceae bacterium]
MSSRKADKPTDAATLARPAAHSTPPTPGGDHAQVQDGDASGHAAATNPHGPRSASAPRAGRRRNTDPAPFDDPSNYLG